MNNIVFPESSQFVRQRIPRQTGISFKKLIIILYIFGGVSSVIALLSKLVLEPLFLQLTADRSDYTNVARRLLENLNSKLASYVSYVPPIRVSTSGPKYVDAQTQTESTKGDSKWMQQSANEYLDSQVKEINGRELSDNLRRLSLTSKIEPAGELKHSLDGITSYIQSLSYPGIHAFGSPTIDLTPAKKRPDIVSDLKKEIRSIKGTLLTT